jgi:RHS repeat-associated protein
MTVFSSPQQTQVDIAQSPDRYYDPATGEFLTIDPALATTSQPYQYAGDNPLNGTDSTGLCLSGFGWACDIGHGISKEAQWGYNAYQTLQGVSETSLLLIGSGTIGICLSGSAGWAWGGVAEGCAVESGDFSHVGLTGTLGGGGQSPSAGVGLSIMGSNAKSPNDLGGPFGYVSGSAAVGPDVGAYVGGSGFTGFNSKNAGITGCSIGGGLGVKYPLPFGYGGGISNTWVRNIK